MFTMSKLGRSKRAIAATGAVLAATAAVGISTAPTANAATCNSGSACYYWYNANGSSTLKYQNPGNITGQLHSGSYGAWVWNHGVRYPGADHITVTTSLYGTHWRICLHYGAVNFALGSGSATAAKIARDEIVTSWTWRGECKPGEDAWHRY